MKKHLSKAAGQFLMVGVSSTALTQEEKLFFKEVQPKGVTYFRRNVDSPNQLIDLTREIQSLVKHPVLIGIDQEGGRVARLKEPFTVFPGNFELSQAFLESQDPTNIIKKAKFMARELKAIGVNCNFTPVADVMTFPENPIMWGRTFGEEANLVAELVGRTIDVYKQEKVLSCAKHFPGHGDTKVDSHLELPFVDTDKKTLLCREIIPFQKAVAHKVPMIMTAHIKFNQIDAKHPATLSKYFLQTLLRKKLGFTGCIVSDDLEMKAIEHHYETGNACVQALHAGCNLVLVCEDQSKAMRCFEAVSEQMHLKWLQNRLSETKKIYARWHRSYLQPKILRKRKQWGWPSHQNHLKN